jgi:FkbM family methyltransferase
MLDLRLEPKVWIYGSGSFAVDMLSKLDELGFPIRGVIDHVNVGNKIKAGDREFIVQPISELNFEPLSHVVLAICNLHGDLKKISLSLPFGIPVTSPVELFRMFSNYGISLQNYWLSTDFELYSRSNSEIQAFRELLADTESESLLNRILEYRQSGNIDSLPESRPLSEQYLAQDLFTPPKELKIIDLGACQGENLSDFMHAGHAFVDGYLFEPDEDNLRKLKENLLALNIESLSTHPLGAWKESTTLMFKASGTGAASLSDIGDGFISVVALDDFIPSEFHPNFIKMDIEGAELEALEGMVRLIAKHRPHLAVSVYHKPSDLWKIGNFLNLNFPGVYRYHLRVYGEQTFDTILYAVPKSVV